MAQLTLFVPGLFADLFEFPTSQIDAQHWPRLAMLLARAHKQALESTSVERNLLSLCGIELASSGTPPVASVTALVDFAAPSLDGIMRADPVHLRADPNQIFLFNGPSITPSTLEADALLAVLNDGIADIGLSRGDHPGRWYFHPRGTVTSSTSSPNAVNGRSIAGFLPQGEGAKQFAQLMNEVQMLLHGAEINVAREANGMPAINSIWPWGGGKVGSPVAELPNFLVGDDVLLCGIARRFNLDWHAAMQPSDIIDKLAQTNGHAVVVLGSPNGPVKASEWGMKIDDFEHDWASVLLRSLRRMRIDKVRLIADRDSYLLTHWAVFKIWRRPQRFTTGNHE